MNKIDESKDITQEEVTYFEKTGNNSGKIPTIVNTGRFYHLQCLFVPIFKTSDTDKSQCLFHFKGSQK